MSCTKRPHYHTTKTTDTTTRNSTTSYKSMARYMRKSPELAEAIAETRTKSSGILDTINLRYLECCNLCLGLFLSHQRATDQHQALVRFEGRLSIHGRGLIHTACFLKYGTYCQNLGRGINGTSIRAKIDNQNMPANRSVFQEGYIEGLGHALHRIVRMLLHLPKWPLSPCRACLAYKYRMYHTCIYVLGLLWLLSPNKKQILLLIIVSEASDLFSFIPITVDVDSIAFPCKWSLRSLHLRLAE